MIGKLDKFQIERVLCSQTFGHLGSHANGKTYVVPMSYLFHDGKIICYTKTGLKIDLMRKNPVVCFQVEIIEDASHWQSVICWGTFRELKGHEADEAIQLLQRRLHPFRQSTTAPPKHGLDKTFAGAETDVVTCAFEISIEEFTGRFERETR